MNPYSVLNVPLHASDDEIKAAYRRLVKQYHPDRNKSESAKVIIVRVNEAHEILSDPIKRSRYDRSILMQYSEIEQEDPVEQYKREFKLRKQREAKQREKEIIAREKKQFKMARMVALCMLFATLILLVDHYLPPKYYEEIADRGWQQRLGGTRRSRGELISTMHTKNFTIGVPNEVHVNYDYFVKPEIIKISVSPLFHIPETIWVPTQKGLYKFEALRTIYSNIFLLYLLSLSSIFTAVRKEYTLVNYGLCYLPMLIAGIIIYIMIP